MKLAIACMLLLVASFAAAQDLPGYERVLVPVPTGHTYGANGARFTSWLAAGTMKPVRIYPAADGELGTLQPGAPTFLDLTSPSGAGRLLFVESTAADTVGFSQRLGTSSVEGHAFTTPVPVVRERDFLTGASITGRIPFTWRLINVPSESHRTALQEFRHHLRIYNVDGTAGHSVRVDIADLKIPGSLRTAWAGDVKLDRRDANDPSHPTYAVLHLDPLFSHCFPFSSHTPCTGTSVEIEIRPITPGLRYWAVVSTTDNVTQRVDLSVARPR